MIVEFCFSFIFSDFGLGRGKNRMGGTKGYSLLSMLLLFLLFLMFVVTSLIPLVLFLILKISLLCCCTNQGLIM